MHILITGGCGFLGARLARALLAKGSLALAGGPSAPIARLTLCDQAPLPADLQADKRVHYVGGELNALLANKAVPSADTQLIFHLAAAVSAECEAHFDLGMRSNADATLALLQASRAQGTAPVFVYASSLAVFGPAPGLPLPPVIEDNTLPTPQSSYGIQKFVGEQWVADFSRKGFIQGRSVRLMTVSVRPGKPNGAASSFLSGMIREPLAGVRALCPVPPETAVALASPDNTIAGLLCAAQTDAQNWGLRTALNLPALTTTVGAMAQALERVAGPAASALLDWRVDPSINAIVQSWPSRVRASKAHALGLQADTDFEAMVRAYVRDNPDAVRIALPKA